MPVMALMGLSLLGERLLIDRLHMFLDVDEGGAVRCNQGGAAQCRAGRGGAGQGGAGQGGVQPGRFTPSAELLAPTLCPPLPASSLSRLW